jgi:hypothetical protein
MQRPLARLREREGPAAKRWEGEGSRPAESQDQRRLVLLQANQLG